MQRKATITPNIVATFSGNPIKVGATDIKNCQMLCKTHNRAKGNK